MRNGRVRWHPVGPTHRLRCRGGTGRGGPVSWPPCPSSRSSA